MAWHVRPCRVGVRLQPRQCSRRCWQSGANRRHPLPPPLTKTQSSRFKSGMQGLEMVSGTEVWPILLEPYPPLHQITRSCSDTRDGATDVDTSCDVKLQTSFLRLRVTFYVRTLWHTLWLWIQLIWPPFLSLWFMLYSYKASAVLHKHCWIKKERS